MTCSLDGFNVSHEIITSVGTRSVNIARMTRIDESDPSAHCAVDNMVLQHIAAVLDGVEEEETTYCEAQCLRCRNKIQFTIFKAK